MAPYINQETYKVFKCDEIFENEIINEFKGETLEIITNDLYSAYTVLNKIYKNNQIYFKDINNNPVIHYGLLSSKSNIDDLYYYINWYVIDKHNKIIAKGLFMK